MRRVLWLGVALLALGASTAALASSALALTLPENLPVAAETRNGTVKQTSVTSVWKTGATEVVCTAHTGEFTEESGKPLGTFHSNLTCKSAGLPCTGTGEAKEVILTLGTWHLVFDEKGATFEKLSTAILYLVEKSNFTCGGIVPVEVKGEILCLHLNPTEHSTNHEDHCTGLGDNWCKEDKNEKCEGLTKPKLEFVVNGSKKEGEVIALLVRIYPEPVFADV